MQCSNLGRTSAWSRCTALDFYPVAPASNPSILGRPFLPHATLALPNG
ncbi:MULTISPECIES: glycoside hydrolase domain-containing protein [Xanthomonas translucens group]